MFERPTPKRSILSCMDKLGLRAKFLPCLNIAHTFGCVTLAVGARRELVCGVADCGTVVAAYVRKVPLCIKHAARVARRLRHLKISLSRFDGSIQELASSGCLLSGTAATGHETD